MYSFCYTSLHSFACLAVSPVPSLFQWIHQLLCHGQQKESPDDSGIGKWGLTPISSYDHLNEMQERIRGLTNHAETLKNVSNPEAQAARQAALDTLKRISDSLNGAGI